MSPSNTLWAPLGPSPSRQSSDASDDTAIEGPELIKGKLRQLLEPTNPATASGIQLLERIVFIFEQRASALESQACLFPQPSSASPKRKSRDWLEESAGSIAPSEVNFTTLHNLKQLLSRKRAELAQQLR